jgi:polyisoprenoid-binding protein YceI
MRFFVSALPVLAIAASLTLAGDQYALNGDNTKIEFVGTKPNGKHVGGFKSVKGSATVNGADIITLKFSVEIDMNSTYTDTAKLTAHLKSPDFFGVKENPTSKFASTKVEKKDDGYVVTGDLTLNGKTKSIAFPAKVSIADGTLNLSSTFKINRHTWGISYGKGKVDDNVTLTVTLKAKK